MIIRATRVQSRYSEIQDATMIDGRIEIRWSDDSPWLALTGGISEYSEVEWLLLVSLLRLGVARTPSITFTYIEHEEE